MKSLLLSVAIAGLTAAIEPPRVPHQPLGNGTKLIAYNETSSASLRAQSVSIDWVSFGEDGQYIFTDSDGALTLQDVVSGEQDVFVPASQIPEDYWEYWIKPDLSKVLFSTNYTKQYRHSYFADYLILDRETGELAPLDPDQVGDIQYATWSPAGDTIAFVKGNDLYIWKNGTITRITEDGGPDKFNGVPDWVYEEEIHGDRFVLWFSPDGEYVAYLSINETGVPTYTIPYYTDRNNPGTQAPVYPIELELRYPKVGETNPTIEFNLLNVESLESTNIPVDAFPADDLVIGEVSWLTEDHSHVLYRAFNRVQDHEKLVVVNVENGTQTISRERDGSDGWLEHYFSITYLGEIAGNTTSKTAYSNGTATSYFLDLSDESGWQHLYLFPVLGGEPIPLTSGEWEVVSILKVDTERELIYYTSTQGHSTERHIYSVSYTTLETKALVDDSVPAVWSASFSSSGTYYVLSYLGPDVPYQELYSVNSTTPIRVVTDNKAAYTNLQAYKLPNITYFEFEHPDGYTLNAMLRLPASFDPAKKYPVLFTPYGGPGAQEVSKRFQAISWRTYISSDPELEYATLTLDNRGTGYKGRAFRSLVSKQLGKLEAEDQVWAATQLAKESWVDADKIGIWGWSYGGYLTSKVVETNSGAFSFGLITAPVSDWRFYDSMYTERFMKTYEENADGYKESAVHDSTGFKNIAGGFLIQHGTGDDNVHFQHAAVLIDFLLGEGVSPQKLDSQFFTDSDHSINYHNNGVFLYKQLTKKLYEEKQRVPGEEQSHQWSKRREEMLKKKTMETDKLDV